MIIHGVIPAAGKGSRLGMGIPKFLVPIKRNITTLDLLRRRFEPYVTHTHLITAPEARSLLIFVAMSPSMCKEGRKAWVMPCSAHGKDG